MEDESGGLFSIEVDDLEESVDKSKKVPRDFQSEEDFQRQTRQWKPKSEVGELWKTLSLPIEHPTKQQAETILHAIEELYFFRRYQEARKLAEGTLKGELHGELRQTVLDYKEKCEAQILQLQGGTEGPA